MKKIWILISALVVSVSLVSCCPPPPNLNSGYNYNWGRGRQQVLPRFHIHTGDVSLGNNHIRIRGKHGKYFSAYNLGNLLDSLILGGSGRGGRMGRTRINIR